MRILFMGTPDFAVPCLDALAGAGYQLLGVVTQPDRPKGRGRKLAPPPVKVRAEALQLPVFQPAKVKTPEFVAQLRQLAPDLIVVVAFGQLLSPEILAIPRFGCINVHASLLPKYRGAAPIHRAVIAGDKLTGVTTMQMDSGLDTGDMIYREEVPIAVDDNVGAVHDKLAAAGARVLLQTVAALAAGNCSHTPQDDAQATYAAMLDRELEQINWNRPARDIYNLVRGMDPWPGAYTTLDGKVLKIWQAALPPEPPEAEGQLPPAAEEIPPGTIAQVQPAEGFVVQTGQGRLLITEVQLQGSRRMKVNEFLRGRPLTPGTVLDAPEPEVC